MVWAIVVVAIGILGVAAWAGTGRLGEMPGAVIDRPKAHLPDGPVDELFLANLSLPTAGTGYRCSQVDAVLAAHVSGADIEPGTRFDVVRKGYDMQAVDAVIERISVHEYPEVGIVTDDENRMASGLEESSIIENEVGATPEFEQTSLSGEVLDGENADEARARTRNCDLSEEPKRAVRGDSSSSGTGDAG